MNPVTAHNFAKQIVLDFIPSYRPPGPEDKDFVIGKAHDWQALIPQKIAGVPFAEWLEANWHIWTRFVAEANLIWNAGRRHYSARTIVEVLRHQSAIAEQAGAFKINDQCCPPMAMLYTLLYPERKGFFEIRKQREAA